MSIDRTEDTITKEVQSTFGGCPDRRTRELFVELVRHLHDFARETRLTEDEWFAAMDFPARVGRVTTPARQEFVLLADVLVDFVEHGPGTAPDGTEVGEPFRTVDRTFTLTPAAPERRP